MKNNWEIKAKESLRVKDWGLRNNLNLKLSVYIYMIKEETLSLRGQEWDDWWLRLEDWGLRLEDWSLRNER